MGGVAARKLERGVAFKGHCRRFPGGVEPNLRLREEAIKYDVFFIKNS